MNSLAELVFSKLIKIEKQNKDCTNKIYLPIKVNHKM